MEKSVTRNYRGNRTWDESLTKLDGTYVPDAEERIAARLAAALCRQNAPRYKWTPKDARVVQQIVDVASMWLFLTGSEPDKKAACTGLTTGLLVSLAHHFARLAQTQAPELRSNIFVAWRFCARPLIDLCLSFGLSRSDLAAMIGCVRLDHGSLLSEKVTCTQRATRVVPKLYLETFMRTDTAWANLVRAEQRFLCALRTRCEARAWAGTSARTTRRWMSVHMKALGYHLQHMQHEDDRQELLDEIQAVLTYACAYTHVGILLPQERKRRYQELDVALRQLRSYME